MTYSPEDLAFQLLKFQAWGVGTEGVEGPDSLAEMRSPDDPNVTPWEKLSMRRQRDKALSQTPSWWLSRFSPTARERMSAFKTQSDEAARAATKHHDAQEAYLQSLGGRHPLNPPIPPWVRIGPARYPVFDEERPGQSEKTSGVLQQRDKKTGKQARPRLIIGKPAKDEEGNVLPDEIGDIHRTKPFARPLTGPGGRLEGWGEKLARLAYGTSGERGGAKQSAKEKSKEREMIHGLIDRRGYALPEETKWLESDISERHGLAGLSPGVQRHMAEELGLVPKTLSANPWSDLDSDEKTAARTMGFNPKVWDALPENSQNKLLDSWAPEEEEADEAEEEEGVDEEWDEDEEEDEEKPKKVSAADKKKKKGSATGKKGKAFGKKKKKKAVKKKKKVVKKPKKKKGPTHDHTYLDGKGGKKRKWRTISANEAGKRGQTNKYGFRPGALVKNINASHPGGYKSKLPKSGTMTARQFMRKKLFRNKKTNAWADRVHDSIQGAKKLTHEDWVRDHLHPDMDDDYEFKAVGKTGVKRKKKKVTAATGKGGKCKRCGRVHPASHGGKCTYATDSDGNRISKKKKKVTIKGKKKKVTAKGKKKKKAPKKVSSEEEDEDPWGGSDDNTVGTSYDNREPIEVAWSVLKIGR